MERVNRFMSRMPFPVRVAAIYTWWLLVVTPTCLLYGLLSGIEDAYDTLQNYRIRIIMAKADRRRATPAQPREEPRDE
jgi:hypothetical protein